MDVEVVRWFLAASLMSPLLALVLGIGRAARARRVPDAGHGTRGTLQGRQRRPTSGCRSLARSSWCRLLRSAGPVSSARVRRSWYVLGRLVPGEHGRNGGVPGCSADRRRARGEPARERRLRPTPTDVRRPRPAPRLRPRTTSRLGAKSLGRQDRRSRAGWALSKVGAGMAARRAGRPVRRVDEGRHDGAGWGRVPVVLRRGLPSRPDKTSSRGRRGEASVRPSRPI